MKKTILIFYSEICYDQAAFAIKATMEKAFPNCDIILIAENQFVNPITHWAESNFYTATIRNMPWFNKMLYSFRERKLGKFADELQEKPSETKLKPIQENAEMKAIKTQFRKVENIILRFDPDLIICMSPKSIQKIAKVKKRLDIRCPIFAMQTDYAFNSEFVSPIIDGYIVQNEVIAQTMARRNISPKKIFTFGTPLIEEKTMEQFAREETRNFFGIENDLPIISVFGGRFGCDSVKAAFASLISFASKANIIVLTGGSESLSRYLQTLLSAKGIKENIIFVDKIDRIEKIYSVSDIVVTAPTAYITYETIAREIPNIVIKPINKIEKENYAFLTTNGLSLRGGTEDELISSISNLLDNAFFYSETKEKIANVPRDSAQVLSKFLAETIEYTRIENNDKKAKRLDDSSKAKAKQESEQEKNAEEKNDDKGLADNHTKAKSDGETRENVPDITKVEQPQNVATQEIEKKGKKSKRK
ncbi:MAG: hypothetical protein RSD04_02345 [Clostridia bacterium]